MNQTLLNKLTGIVLDNLGDENFGVEQLAAKAGMSRATLHRKIKELKKGSVSQFIRMVRLQKAMEMLKDEEGTVAEVAYRVGFGSPTYFIKCFHDHYGFPPGEVKKMDPLDYPAYQRDEQGDSPPGDDGLQGKPPHEAARKKIKRNRILVSFFSIIIPLLLAVILYTLLKQPQKSIVVLPFRNLSDEPGTQYFADGIMEDILNNLFRISELRVISRTSAEYFRDSQMTSPEIARKLHVDYVLEGSVQKQGEEVRIFTQLIDARNDQHLLSEKYEGEMENIFDFQSNIAAKVAGALQAVISSSEKSHIEERPTKSTEAYDNYLKARFLNHKANDEQRFDINKEGLMASLQYYEKAVKIDPQFAEAWAGLANAWYNLAAWGWYQPYYEGVQKAWEYCNKALELDPECAEAHAVKGVYHMLPERRFDESRKELQLALELNPNFSTAHQWYAQLMMITGPIEEAREHVNRTLELEPYFWVMHNLDSWICYFEERYSEGLQACFTGYDLNPYSSDNNWLFFLHYVKLGKGEEAAKIFRDVFRTNSLTEPLAEGVMKAYEESGIPGIFNWLIDINMNNPVPLQGLNGNPYYLAWWHALNGNKEESIHWFERTLEAEKVPMHYFNLVAQNPDFDFLRDDPRFLAVIEKAGLAPYNKRKAR
ncbi:MAG: helix-turn-helix domain-containing protein [Bacteroidales bacterium]|nr:helix-turn-helix domain-containing protein [Bacteroidales bacterium]